MQVPDYRAPQDPSRGKYVKTGSGLYGPRDVAAEVIQEAEYHVAPRDPSRGDYVNTEEALYEGYQRSKEERMRNTTIHQSGQGGHLPGEGRRPNGNGAKRSDAATRNRAARKISSKLERMKAKLPPQALENMNQRALDAFSAIDKLADGKTPDPDELEEVNRSAFAQGVVDAVRGNGQGSNGYVAPGMAADITDDSAVQSAIKYGIALEESGESDPQTLYKAGYHLGENIDDPVKAAGESMDMAEGSNNAIIWGGLLAAGILGWIYFRSS